MTLKFKPLIEYNGSLSVFDDVFTPNSIFSFPDISSVKSYLFGLNLFDINKKEIFQGDILKIIYQDRTSYIFEAMKNYNDDVIYLYLKPHNDFLFTIGSFSDEKKYPATSHEDITFFLKYLTSIGACEIIGNIYDDYDFIKNNTLTKNYYKMLEISEKTSIVKSLVEQSLTNIHNYILDMLSLYNFYNSFLNSCTLKSVSFYENNNVNKDIFKVSITCLFQHDNISSDFNKNLQNFLKDIFYSIDTDEYQLYQSNDTYEILPTTHFNVSTTILDDNNFESFELILPIRLKKK